MRSSNDGTSALLSEPLLGFIGGDALEFAEFSASVLSASDSLASATEDNVEIHTENTGVGIILDSEIDVFVNTEAEVAYNIK